MGNCLTDCIEVFCQHEYERIPDDDQEQDGKESRSSVTTITNHSDIHPWDEIKNQENILPPQLRQFYSMGDLVGIGTTSKVYKVQYLINGTWGSSDKQPLVCKIIDKKGIIYNVDDGDVDPLLEQLSREVEILKRIHHPNIVTFYDYMETKDKLYIITERLDGGELFEYILQHGPLLEDFACKILFGVFSAVAYLHERGVVHRDIKAENLIFFKDADGNDALKLIDFGFSTVLRHQLTGSFMGTGGYIAPEIRQNKNYSTSVDSWSLGVLLYCTLSARLPFGISIDSLPSSIDECRGMFALVFPAKIWDQVSNACRDLITRLLEIDPNVRLSAKDALRHPWFSSQLERMELSLESSHCIRQSDWDASPGADIELPALHSPLRRTQSMSELERRGSEPISTKTRTGSSPYPLAELESVPTPDRYLSSSTSERKPPCKGLLVGEEESLLGPSKEFCSSYQSCAGSYSSSSAEGSRSGERRVSACSRSGTDEGMFEHKCYALWEETHKASAGELFYTTFQRGLSSSHRQHS